MRLPRAGYIIGNENTCDSMGAEMSECEKCEPVPDGLIMGLPTDEELLGMFPEDASAAEIVDGLMRMHGLGGRGSAVFADPDRAESGE